MVADQQVAAVLGRVGEPHEAAAQLIDDANAAGGADNVSVVIINVAAE